MSFKYKTYIKIRKQNLTGYYYEMKLQNGYTIYCKKLAGKDND